MIHSHPNYHMRKGRDAVFLLWTDCLSTNAASWCRKLSTKWDRYRCWCNGANVSSCWIYQYQITDSTIGFRINNIGLEETMLWIWYVIICWWSMGLWDGHNTGTSSTFNLFKLQSKSTRTRAALLTFHINLIPYTLTVVERRESVCVITPLLRKEKQVTYNMKFRHVVLTLTLLCLSLSFWLLR
jgi:hypothetical protein